MGNKRIKTAKQRHTLRVARTANLKELFYHEYSKTENFLLSNDGKNHIFWIKPASAAMPQNTEFFDFSNADGESYSTMTPLSRTIILWKEKFISFNWKSRLFHKQLQKKTLRSVINVSLSSDWFTIVR